MVDYTSSIAGNYKGTGPVIECILNEGVPTVTATTHMPTGETVKTAVFAAAPYSLEEGMVVGLANDVENTYIATEGMPVVERAQTGESLVIGQIISPPRWKSFPATSGVATPWATQLAGKYYRTALVEFHVAGRIVRATIATDGTRVCTPGVCTTFGFNITQGYASGADGYFFDMDGNAHGVNCIPLHYIASSTDGDLFTALVLLTGMLHADTGA